MSPDLSDVSPVLSIVLMLRQVSVLPDHSPPLIFPLLLLSRAVFPLPSRTGGGDWEAGAREAKARPLVSEVRPLMEQQHSRTQDRRVSWNQDRIQKQYQDQTSLLQDQIRTNQDQTQTPQVKNQIQQGTNQLQSQVEEEETCFALLAHRPSPLKKKIHTGVDSKRNLGPTARAAASHLSSSGLRKTQSVHSLLSDTGNTVDIRTTKRRAKL